MTVPDGDRGGPSKELAIGLRGSKPAMITCPECGAENIQGTDYCVNCNSDLRTLDIPPETWSPGEGPPGETLARLGHGDPLHVGPGTSIRDVIAKLRDTGHGCAVVAERGRVMGVFTERDVLRQVTLNRDQMLDMPVAEVMTTDPVVLSEDDSVLVAINKMGVGGFRHIPLVDAQRTLRGVLTARDILAYVGDIIDRPS